MSSQRKNRNMSFHNAWYVPFRETPQGESFPKFEQSSDWFNSKMLKHMHDLKEEWTYHSHLAAITESFKACMIISSKKIM